jgi:hypothetical protein
MNLHVPHHPDLLLIWIWLVEETMANKWRGKGGVLELF